MLGPVISDLCKCLFRHYRRDFRGNNLGSGFRNCVWIVAAILVVGLVPERLMPLVCIPVRMTYRHMRRQFVVSRSIFVRYIEVTIYFVRVGWGHSQPFFLSCA